MFSCEFFEIFKKTFSYKAPTVVASKSNSTYSSIVLENINSDIPIALNLTASPQVKQAEENQAANYQPKRIHHLFQILEDTLMKNTTEQI